MGKMKNEWYEGLDKLEDLCTKQLALFDGLSEEEYPTIDSLPLPLKQKAYQIEEEKVKLQKYLSYLLGCELQMVS